MGRAGPVEVSEEGEVVAASGFRTSQLLVIEWAPMYVAEAGVLMGMLGGDIVEELKAEMIRGFA